MQNDTSHYDKCRTMMLTHKKHHMTRITVIGILLLINAFITIIKLPIQHGLPYLYGFAFGMTAVLYSAGIGAAAFFAVPEKLKLLILCCVLTVVGMIVTFINPAIGIVILLACATEFPECKQASWLQKQEGYPHFNERFNEQMQYFGKEYQPDHPLDNLHEAQMQNIPEDASPDFELKSGSEMPEIPDIPDISENTERFT